MKFDANGNLVATLATEDPRTVVQENHYDPWGLNLVDIETTPPAVTTVPGLDWWQYNAQSEKSYLPDGSFDYDTDFRAYDPQIGRFRGVDGLADKYTGINGYNFVFNNPLSFQDPSGLFPSIDPITLLNLQKGLQNAFGNILNTVTVAAPKLIGGNVLGKILPFAIRPMGEILTKPKFPVSLPPPAAFAPVLAAALVFVPTSAGAGSSKSERGIGFDGPGLIINTAKNFGNFSKEEYYRYKYLQNREKTGTITSNERQELQDFDDIAFEDTGIPYSVYQRRTDKNGDFDYVGSAIREDLKKRYPKDYKNANNLVFKIPNRDIALGVEEAIMQLNGGAQKLNPNTPLANINRAVQEKKLWRLKLGERWLNKQYPNWKEVFKFTK